MKKWFTVLFVTLSVLSYSQTTRHVPSHYTSIQAAVNASQQGDTVAIAAGNYAENIDLSGKMLVVIGEGNPEDAVISAQAETGLTGAGAGTIISSLTFRDCDKAAYITKPTVFVNCRFINNKIGIHDEGENYIHVTNCLFAHNQIAFQQNYHWGAISSFINNSTFADNITDINRNDIRDNASDLIIINSILTDEIRNDALDIPVKMSYCNYNTYNINGAVIPVTGNLSAIPGFVNPSGGDYTLRPGSPDRKMGNPNTFYNNPDGTRNDMGFTGGNGVILSFTEFNFGCIKTDREKELQLHIFNYRNTPVSISRIESQNSQLSTSNTFPLIVKSSFGAVLNLSYRPIQSGVTNSAVRLYSGGLNGNTNAELPVLARVINYNGKTIHVPNEAPSIMEALDAMDAADTILVAPGTYTEVITLNNKKPVLISEKGYSRTILEGNNARIIIDGAEGASIKGFTLRNAKYAIRTKHSLSISDCKFYNNDIGITGSEIHGLNVYNCLFSHNKYGFYQSCHWGNLHSYIYNSTFINNTSAVYRTDIRDPGSDLTIYNSIIRDNCTNARQDVPVKLYNCSYDPAKIGSNISLIEGNQTADPLFVNPLQEDYHLQSASPCINAGIASTANLPLPLGDLDGNARIWNGKVDIGTFEFGSQPVSQTIFLSSPAIYAINVSGSATLKWQKPSEAPAGYCIQVASDSNFSNVVVNDCSLTNNFYQLPGLLSNTKYYWKVTAQTLAGTFLNSDTWNFTTSSTTADGWMLTPTNVTNWLYGVSFSDTSNGLAVGDWMLLRTSDGGKSWNQLNLPQEFNTRYRGAAYSDINQAVLVGEGGMIIRTTDNGSSWTKVNSGTINWLNKIIFTDKSTGFAVGQNNTILKTQDGGKTWTRQNSTAKLTSDLSDVSFINNNTGFVVSQSGEVLKTTDSGQNWALSSLGESMSLKSVFIIDENNAAILGYGRIGDNPDPTMDGRIMHTTDGGKTWFEQNRPEGVHGQFYSVCFRSLTKGIIAANEGGIFSTTDGGTTWTKQISGVSIPLWDVASDQNKITIIGGNGTILRNYSFPPVLLAPGKPVLKSPSDSTVNCSVNLMLTWNPAADASYYILQVAKDSLFKNIIISDPHMIGESKDLKNLENKIRYFWRIQSVNDDWKSSYSDAWSFTTIARPDAPAAVTPQNAAVNQSVNLQLKWTKTQGAERYHLQLSADKNFLSFVVNDSTVADTLLQPAALSHNTNYYWRVRAINIGGVSPWSETRTFQTIVSLPPVPALVSPVDGSNQQLVALKLSWQPSQDAETYRVLLSRDPLFTDNLIDDSTLAAPSKEISGLAHGMKYYWKVSAKNIAGLSSYSPVWNFITFIPSPDNLTAVASGPKKVKLSWMDESEGESGFILERKSENETSYKVIDSVKANATEYTDSTVSYKTTYKYRLKAYTQYINSNYSADISVTSLTSVESWESEIPTEYSLKQNYPNPFNPSTMIRYSLPYESRVKISIFNSLGELVSELVNKVEPAGNYEKAFNAQNLPSGIYIYSISVQAKDGKNNFTSVKKMMLVK